MLLPWGTERRALDRIAMTGRLRVAEAAADAAVEAFKAKVRMVAEYELFSDCDEVMDEAERRAAVNPHRAMLYMDMAMAFMEFKMQAHQIIHYPPQPPTFARFL